MSIDSISSLYEICKFFILPFIGVEVDASIRAPTPVVPSSPPLTVKLFPRAQGLFEGHMKITFLSTAALIQVTNIEGNLFRIIICEAETAMKSVRIDLEYDDTSFNGMFAVVTKDEYIVD